MAKRILVTGHLGYIGSVMAPHLEDRGYIVRGVDTGYFESCRLPGQSRTVPGQTADIRNLSPRDLQGFDAVVHLAALSNDPIGNLNGQWTRDINENATISLAKLAREAGVSRFLFSSSCIMYGSAGGTQSLVDENSPLDPRTDYARSKVQAELALARLASSSFSPVFLRNGTVYGLSPRMRFDTVLNSLAGAAAAMGRVRVLSDGTPWRPVVHVEDVCEAFRAVLEAPAEAIHNQAFNVGADSVNVQIGELARCVRDASEATVEICSEPDADQRTYRTSFAKIRDRVPEFRAQWTPAAGARRLVEEFRALPLDRAVFQDSRFTRLRWLRGLLDQKVLDGDLRWAPAPEAAAS